jgi:anti-anti-sigma factor
VVGSELFRVSVARSGDTALVRLDGELDCATAPQLTASLDELFRSGGAPRRLLFDAQHLTFVDVAGLRPLIHAAHLLPGGCSLRNAPSKVRYVVSLLQLDEALGVDA